MSQHADRWFLLLAIVVALVGLALLPGSTTGYAIAETILGPVGVVSYLFVVVIVGLALATNALRTSTRKPALEDTVAHTDTPETTASDFLMLPPAFPDDAPQDVRDLLAAAEDAAIAGDETRANKFALEAAKRAILQNYRLPAEEIADLRVHARRSHIRNLLLEAYKQATVPEKETEASFKKAEREAQRLIDEAERCTAHTDITIARLPEYQAVQQALSELTARIPVQRDDHGHYKETITLFKRAGAQVQKSTGSLSEKIASFTKARTLLNEAVANAKRSNIPERVYEHWEQPIKAMVRSLADETMLEQATRVRDMAMRGEWDPEEIKSLLRICETTGHPGADEYVLKMARVAYARIEETSNQWTIAQIMLENKALARAHKKVESGREYFGKKRIEALDNTYAVAQDITKPSRRLGNRGELLHGAIKSGKLPSDIQLLAKRLETILLKEEIERKKNDIERNEYEGYSYRISIGRFNILEQLMDAPPLVQALYKNEAFEAFSGMLREGNKREDWVLGCRHRLEEMYGTLPEHLIVAAEQPLLRRKLDYFVGYIEQGDEWRRAQGVLHSIERAHPATQKALKEPVLETYNYIAQKCRGVEHNLIEHTRAGEPTTPREQLRAMRETIERIYGKHVVEELDERKAA